MRQGAEKMREMEEILAGAGQFSEQFDLTLGDVMIEDADGDGPPENPDDIPKPPVPKPKPSAFPSIDGEETVDEFVNRYKKALLNKRSQFRTIHEQWQSNPPKTGQCLVLHTSYCFFSGALITFGPHPSNHFLKDYSGFTFSNHLVRDEWTALQATDRDYILHLAIFFTLKTRSLKLKGSKMAHVFLANFVAIKVSSLRSSKRFVTKLRQ